MNIKNWFKRTIFKYWVETCPNCNERIGWIFPPIGYDMTKGYSFICPNCKYKLKVMQSKITQEK
jgi:predicted RNA-binding Zn-ribbon protein involved in translation (DUF1610 family)